MESDSNRDQKHSPHKLELLDNGGERSSGRETLSAIDSIHRVDEIKKAFYNPPTVRNQAVVL